MMDELKDKFVTQLAEEIEDSNMYYELSMKVANHGHNHALANGLYEISKDEYTHAKFIHDCLVKHGICIPDALKCKWETIMERACYAYPDVPHRMYNI